ncbi:hypothetical protein L6164_025196 [Bauhinia variegata]|uniref:Uncharacterized protein n=1 Tax=Bauhinia variegata TaxID=167791 RepID=A0ACB9M067_BAUVA|nr:hypothetical protein L6164_025196 [Bauhinia variegata]
MPNMLSAISLIIPAPSNASSLVNFSKDDTFQYSKPMTLKLCNKKGRKYWVRSGKWIHCSPPDINLFPKLNAKGSSFYNSSLRAMACPIEFGTCSGVVADKLRRLVLEFKSLPGPIDRVKSLLHYASLLPPLDDSARMPENRVKGCATQVWLVSEMDECGRMRFKADSDSEISKGFCSCLIWMLDGAEPWEVLRVEREDLADLNVGLHGKAQSRVNTWHNVLFSMQKAAEALVMEMEEKPPLNDLPSLIATADNIRTKENFAGLRVQRLPVLRYPFYTWFSVKWSYYKLEMPQVHMLNTLVANHKELIHRPPEVASFNERKRN